MPPPATKATTTQAPAASNRGLRVRDVGRAVAVEFIVCTGNLRRVGDGMNVWGPASSADNDLRRDGAVHVQVGVEAVHGTARAGPAVEGLVLLHEPDVGAVHELGHAGRVDTD